MAVEFLDTNVFIRYLTGDNPDQSGRSLALIQKVETGDIQVTTCEGVLVEIVQVLSSRQLYNRPRSSIASTLSDIVRLRGLRLPNKVAYLRALEIYASTNLDFVDALAVAHMGREGIQTIVSFDRHFDRLPQVARREP